MQPARNITPTDWMLDYKCVKVMRVLGGFEETPQALFVGGCVRNMLMGKPVRDVDIATSHHPLQVIERLQAAGLRFVPTGLDHGTVTALVEDASFEITTLRKDIDTNGRHAVIAFTDKWEEDALRRDFTMNTLLCSIEGAIYDPTGMGLTDLEKRKVVFVGDASERIAEDYLRILRYFRIHAEYGEGEMDADALAACKDAAGKVSELSKERVTQELLKIMAIPDPTDVLSTMFVGCNILKSMAENTKAQILKSLCDFQGRHNAVDVMARLFAIGGMKETSFEKWLVLSNAQKKSLESYAEGFIALKSVSKKTVRKAIYAVGNEAVLQSYFLRLAQKEELPNLDVIDMARYWHAPEFPIKADHLIEKGFSRGPALGKKLKELEDKWIAKDFPENYAYKK